MRRRNKPKREKESWEEPDRIPDEDEDEDEAEYYDKSP